MFLAFWKFVKRTGKRFISGLPEQLRFPIIRKLVRYKPSDISDFEVRFVNSAEEVVECLELVRTAYLERGFLTFNDPKIMNPYFYNPDAALVIMRAHQKPVGTFLIATGQGKGLPLERVFSINKYKKNSTKNFEISALAISKDFRREQQFNGLFYMMKFLYYHLSLIRGGDFLFATCLPRDTDFYRAILLFEFIQGQSSISDYMGAPADCVVLDLNTVKERMTKLHKIENLRLYDFLLNEVGPQLHIHGDFQRLKVLLNDTETFRRHGWTHTTELSSS